MMPLTSDVAYGDVGTDFNILQGLTNKIRTSGVSGYIKKIDYTRNLFCFEEVGGNLHTGECCFTTNNHYMWGWAAGLPEEGKEGVKVFAVGCYVGGSTAASHSADCHYAVKYNVNDYAGSFAVPQLKLKQ